MKKGTVFILVMVMVLLTVGHAGAATSSKPDVKFVIDGKAFQTPKGEPEPYVNKDKRTMVSIRFFSSAIGMASKDVKWNNKTQTATLKRNGTEATIMLGSPIMKVNGTSVTMDTKAEMNGGRLFIPVRYAAIALGVYFEWDGDRKVITIDSKEEVESIPAFKYVLPGDEVFDYPKIEDMMNMYSAKPDKNKLLFRFGRNGEDTNYTLKNTLNPKINEQIFSVTKVLLDENHFVNALYNEADDTFGGSVFLTFARNAAFAQRGGHYFKFSFEEEKPYNMREDWNYAKFSDKVSISLELRDLWEDATPGVWSVPFYEHKLRSSLIAIFGETEGVPIGDYVVAHYLKKRTQGQATYKGVHESKQFGKTQVDFADDGSNAILNFEFSGKW
ncbi:copper amine oxidase N-terminal domain-containing protein [Cohnella mopanensis]|uniref:copper amine oxidase N-terminal domain-containing protein n=1 Tax=Cohnella mopanensis TaxID=2911966 RepID=UPI001EF92C2B|nr:copper amine oxidase N-terminal domain-containing protein [Cohnella mopanensis]